MAVDYSAIIKKKREADPMANVDAELVARYEKVQADPTLSKQYGTDSYSEAAKKILAAKTTLQPTDNSTAISGMYDAQLAAQMGALNAARDQANSDYQAQIGEAPTTFRPQRDAVDVGTARNLQRANETAAAKGTAFTGGVASDQGAMVSSGEGQKTALTQQEINLVQNLKKAISDNNKATSYKQIELNANTTAQKNAALIDEANRIYGATYQQSQDQFNQGIAVGNLTGNYNGGRTLAGAAQDYGKERDAVADNQWLATFNYQKDRDTVADGQWMKNFEQNKADAAASRAISWGNLQLNRDQYEWSKNPNNPNNIAKIVEGEEKAYQDTFKQAWDMMGTTEKVFDSDSGQYVDKAPQDLQERVGRLILSSKLSDSEKDRLANALSLGK